MWHREIEQIYKAGERATSLTRQLLAFSRQQNFSPRVLDLNATVSDMNRLLRRLLGEDITLATALDPRIGGILADPGHIEQIVMNLAVNSRDAMPDGGKLLIETGNAELDDSYARRHSGVAAGSYVMLAVSDTGSGMDEETQAHMFEPFFTTKPMGKGTGLGLSTVFGIVQQAGGSVWVYSELGKGTTFKIYFPRVAQATDKSAQTLRAGTPAGTETVLIVEDEQAVRMLMASVLKRAGYTVLEAGNGTEALQVCEKAHSSIDLVVSDVVMPEMSGPDLLKRLKEFKPDIKVLFVSGYTANAMVEHAAFDSKTPFLQKPFTAAGLARKVRESIDRS
jgi:CheY-like chemotaxis protein